MFTLLRGLWKYIFQRNEYYLLILGLDNAGKTTFFEHVKRKYSVSNYKGIAFEKIAPTVGMNMGKIDMQPDIAVLWDVGGQEELQSLWNKYFLDCHGVVYIIDASDKQRLDESYACFDALISNDELEGVPLLVLANKQDRANAMQSEAIKQIFNESAHKLGKRDCTLHEISALDGKGITESMEWMFKCVRRNLSRPPKLKDIV